MRILLTSYAFAPSLGGIETVSALLANEFARAGHEVKVVTDTPGDDGPEGLSEVFRRPRNRALLELVRWSEICFHNNISLRSAWPLLLVQRPFVVAHQTWLETTTGKSSLSTVVKRFALQRATNIAISSAIAGRLDCATTIIGNPFRDDVFAVYDGYTRDLDLIFVGRLVSDKGVDILLQSIYHLRARGLAPTLTIVGSGPEEQPLRQMCIQLGISSQVDFVGSKSSPELPPLLNRHRILVVPSTWEEPFGIVALEGVACGCVIVGSDGGGLPEAIGPCGLLFKRGDACSLASQLVRVLQSASVRLELLKHREDHLSGRTSSAVSGAYLHIFASILAAKKKPRRVVNSLAA